MAGADVVFAEVGPGDVELVAARMRAADKNEVLASAGFLPRQALEESLKLSVVARALWVGGELAGLFGVVDAEGAGIPWAMTTDVVDRRPFEFWQASKAALRVLREPFPVMVQRVDARYGAALRWLARLGFTVGPAEPWGRYALPFHLVTLGTAEGG